MKKGLFARSFDPPTFGHLDIIGRAAKLCDELVGPEKIYRLMKHHGLLVTGATRLNDLAR